MATLIKAETIVEHKTLGKAVVQKILDFDGTNIRSTMLTNFGICFIKLDNPPKGWAEVVQVDVEALKIIEN